MSLIPGENKKSVDPVCGMTVVPDVNDLVTIINGKKFHFCAESCKQLFEKDPRKFLSQEPKKKKGIWSRYLDRLEKVSGGRAMKCH